MTVTEPLAVFLKARLDEDEATARAVPAVPQGELANQAGPCINDAAYIYIRRHDPVRVLREVEAKRAIVAEYESSVRSVGPGLSVQLRELVEALAAVYSDHPDYREEW